MDTDSPAELTAPRILIAGIGEGVPGDDAFGREVVLELAKRVLPKGVRVRDFGGNGFDLGYALLDEYDVAILVDSTPHEGSGEVHVCELDPVHDECADGAARPTNGRMSPMKALRLAARFGLPTRRMFLIDCGLAPSNGNGGGNGACDLKHSPLAAIGEIEQLVAKLHAGKLTETLH